jgi:magnesium transporter
MPFRAYYFDPDGQMHVDINKHEIRTAFESKKGMLWVDVHQPTDEDGQFLRDCCGFHRLAVEDCMSTHLHPPKVDDFGDYLFIILHGINYSVRSEIVETAELAIFLGAKFVVTSHSLPMYSVDSAARLVEEDGRPMHRGADFLVHQIVDGLIDNILPTIDAMSERAEEIEEAVIRSPQPPTLEAIIQFKRSAAQLHRVVAPQREVLNRLSRREFAMVSNEAQMFYRDIYDHVARIEDLNQSLRDRAGDALSTYLSSVANRQNEIMKLVSIVAAIFLPMMLVAGIYGMNFEHMPELEWSWAYFAVLGFMGFVIVSSVAWFWSRSWITWGRRRARLARPFIVDRAKLVGYLSHVVPKREQFDDMGFGS